MNTNINLIRKKLLLKYPLFGSVLSKTEFIENNSIETAATDGENIYYNSSFLSELNKNEQVFLFAHEICHIVFKHFSRCEDRNVMVWNYATDAVINAFLQKDGLPIINGGIEYEGAINYDAETLYEKMIKDNNYNQENNQNNGHDDHSMWQNNKNKTSNDQSNNNKEKNSSINGNSQSDEKQKEENETLSEKDIFSKNSQERKNNLNKMKQEMISDSIGLGNSLSQERKIKLEKSTKSLNWKALLKEATINNQDWSYKNATIENGVVTSNLEDIMFSETEIVLDTSGSVNDTMLSNFVSECIGIITDSKIKIGCFDTSFYGFTEINDVDDLNNFKFQGYGGTDFNCAVQAFTPNAQNKIIFTDGYAPMPKEYLDAIWICYGNQKINPPGGKVFYADPNEFKKDNSYSK